MPRINCRSCGRQVWYRKPGDAPFFPFCSRRCRMIDLGKWFREEYRISTPMEKKEEPSADEQQPGEQEAEG